MDIAGPKNIEARYEKLEKSGYSLFRQTMKNPRHKSMNNIDLNFPQSCKNNENMIHNIPNDKLLEELLPRNVIKEALNKQREEKQSEIKFPLILEYLKE